ncbi:sigma-54 dependent transcriptional regulator [uncultured Muribaculum sp.]|uniref:sigma-54-dependent transcriptional regulator n=2 Tax=uncultured Muribaculum sp. TaxID=1918613 RepID=UPI0025B22EEC|nr:sigma-54 dependent transcriptional regulator [uncultured Muribaculum sp.]
MILIVDDDKAIRTSLSLLLKRAGYDIISAASPNEAMTIVRQQKLEMAIMDMNFTRATTGDEGLILLRQVKIFQPELPVILITAWGSIPLAVEGMKKGAFDFITKPWDNKTLLQRVKTALQLNVEPVTGNVDAFDRSEIIGNSNALTEVLDKARRVAPTDASVLITGENGTGKELIAQAIHRNSKRRDNPFVMVNLGGISQSLFESEMFGHAKGAFTGAVDSRKGRFELADTGTIFLDEIGDLDLSCQVKMLRVLQQHTFEPLGDSNPRHIDIRVICATNADLQAMVADGSFREDLMYRINLIKLHLPPLRERRDDIPLLIRHFASLQNAEFSSEAIEYLSKLPYPGNIRQLKNIVDSTILITGKNLITLADTQPNISATDMDISTAKIDNGSGLTINELERNTILKTIEETGGNISQMASRLGITRQSLYRRLKKYGIDL